MKIIKNPVFLTILALNTILLVFSLHLSENYKREIKSRKTNSRQNSTTNQSSEGSNLDNSTQRNRTTFGIPDPLRVTVKLDNNRALIGDIEMTQIKSTSGKQESSLYFFSTECAASNEANISNIFTREESSRLISYCLLSDFHCSAPMDISKPRSINGIYRKGLEMHSIILEENEMNLKPGNARLSVAGCFEIADQLNKKSRVCHSKCAPLKPDLTRLGSQVIHYKHIADNSTETQKEIARIDNEIESQKRQASESRSGILAGEKEIADYEFKLANIQQSIQDREVKKAAQMEMLNIYQRRLEERLSRVERISNYERIVDKNNQAWEDVSKDLRFHCVKDEVVVDQAYDSFDKNDRDQFYSQISSIKTVCMSIPKAV